MTVPAIPPHLRVFGTEERWKRFVTETMGLDRRPSFRVACERAQLFAKATTFPSFDEAARAAYVASQLGGAA